MMIGLVGFIGSGKGTVGDIFENQFGYTRDSFARPLKDAVSMIFGWDRDLLEGASPESRTWREQPDEFWSGHFGYEFTPRHALQLMGTEACRDIFHSDIWVISLLHRHQGGDVVITDVRFKNEVQLIRKHGGFVVRVQRGPDPFWYDTALKANRYENEGAYAATREMEKLGIHISEWDWIGSEIDYTIYNNGTIDDLHDHVSTIIQTTKALTTASKS